MSDPVDNSNINSSRNESSDTLDQSRRLGTGMSLPQDNVLSSSSDSVIPHYNQTGGVQAPIFFADNVSSGSVSPMTTSPSVSSYPSFSDMGDSKDYLDLLAKEGVLFFDDPEISSSMASSPILGGQDSVRTFDDTGYGSQDADFWLKDGSDCFNVDSPYAIFSPFREPESLRSEDGSAPSLSHAHDLSSNLIRPISVDDGLDDTGGQAIVEEALYNQKDVMKGYADSLGYFPTMQEWDTILTELGDIEKIEVGKTTYNVSVAKDFLKTTMAAFCYLGREKKVDHNPSLFNTLVEELFGAKFKDTNHAIKIWQNVFIQFNAIRVVLSMKADKARNDDRRQGLVKTSPVTERLMFFLELVRDFEKDLWRALPADKKQSLRASITKSKDKNAIIHLDAVARGSPQRRSRQERSSGSPLSAMSRSTTPVDDALGQRMSDELSVDFSKKDPLHQDLFGDPSIQREIYRQLSSSPVLGHHATPSSKVAALKTKLEHYNNDNTSKKISQSSSPSGKALCSSRKKSDQSRSSFKSGH